MLLGLRGRGAEARMRRGAAKARGRRAEDGGPRADTLAIREFLIQKKDE